MVKITSASETPLIGFRKLMKLDPFLHHDHLALKKGDINTKQSLQLSTSLGNNIQCAACYFSQRCGGISKKNSVKNGTRCMKKAGDAVKVKAIESGKSLWRAEYIE